MQKTPTEQLQQLLDTLRTSNVASAKLSDQGALLEVTFWADVPQLPEERPEEQQQGATMSALMRLAHRGQREEQ